MKLSHDLAYFLLQHFCYLSLNFGILVAMVHKGKSASYFTVNLVVASIAVILLLLTLGLDHYGVLDLTGPWMCGMQALMKKFVGGVIPLTLVGISYERVRSLPRVYPTRCIFTIWQVVCRTWVVSFALSLPQYFAYEFSPVGYNSTVNQTLLLGTGNYSWETNLSSMPHILHSSQCRKTPLMGHVLVKVAYESLLCILLHLSPSAYIIYALYKIKFKCSYICMNKTMKVAIGPILFKRLKQIRLAYFYSIFFALMWVPYGIVTVWRASTEDPYRTVVNANFKSPKRNVQSGLEGAFVTIHPILYLYTHHKDLLLGYLKKCKISRTRHDNATRDECDDEIMAVSTIPLETFKATA